MRRSIANIVLSLGLAVLLHSPAAASPRPKVIAGQIVAYSNFLGCFNGNEYPFVIVRVRNTKHVPARFIEVRLSVPCGTFPAFLSAHSTTQKFRLIRAKSRNGILDQFANTINVDTGRETKDDPSFPLWIILPGAEEEELPFGQMVPSYLSVDFPLKPLF